MLFGKKKKDLPAGVRMMQYEGLRGFSQDGPCFLEKTEAGLVFQEVNGPAATLPAGKGDRPGDDAGAQFHGPVSRHGGHHGHGKAVKWFAVFHYTTQEGERMLALWYQSPKPAAFRELAAQIGAATQDYTL